MDEHKSSALWKGRFSDSPDSEALSFETSIDVDMRLYSADIAGSIAHAKMLNHIALLTDEECESITAGLTAIKADLDSGVIAPSPNDEDIHSFIENTLTARIGDAGKKLHTARSRNDQIALDERLWMRDYIKSLQKLLNETITVICDISQNNTNTIMPGFTHTQHAQCVTLAHHLLAYGMEFLRDKERLGDALKRVDECPIGSGALATSTYNIDRTYEAELLGFSKISQNSMDAVSDRDHFIELAADLSIIAVHLSRICADIIFWATSEAGFCTLSEHYSTGSSIMPQKKNADFAELIRGKASKVIGNLTSLLSMLKGLPMAYNRDLQEDKASLFSSCDIIDSCLKIFNKMLSSIEFHRDKMLLACKSGFLNATDVAEYLVKKGMPFRNAHAVAASLVGESEDRHCTLEDLPLDIYKEKSALFNDDIIDAIQITKCVESRNVTGGPAACATKKQIDFLRSMI